MFRHRAAVVLGAVLLVAGNFTIASAQTATAPASTDAKPSRMKLTVQKLKDMKAKWSANRPKLKACYQDVKAKGLIGDDRWFYIEDCMTKS
jgi:hypothetical protein